MAKYNCIPTVPNRNKMCNKKTVAVMVLYFVMQVLCLSIIALLSKQQSEVTPVDHISCYFTKENDALQSAEENSFRPDADRSIYFHETSCRGDLTVRQLCSVEAAARAHPLWQIYVLFSGPVNKTTLLLGNIRALNSLNNVNLLRVHLLEYARNTPVQALVSTGAIIKSFYRYAHTSDVLRCLTLYKWGGVYLDLDVVVARPLTALAKSWAARESDKYVNSGSLAFRTDRVGRKVAALVLEEIRRNFKGDDWGQNGPLAVTNALEKICSTRPINMSAESCQGFEVYDKELFHPVSWWDTESAYFKKGNITSPHAYTHHLWNKNSKYYKVENASPYQKLAKEHCPTMYKAFRHEFGS